MAATIVSRVIVTEDRRMSIGNNQFVRRTDAGSGWNVMRLGVRLTVNTTASLSGVPELYLGMCNYDGGWVGASSTSNFAGVVTTDSSWSRTAGTPSYLTVSNVRGVVRVGITDTTTTSISMFLTATPAAYRCLLLLTIDKTTPAATVISLFHPNNAVTGVNDIAQSTLLSLVQTASPSLTGYTTSTFPSLVLDEGANGVLDAVNISWDRTTTPFEFSDVAYHVFS